MLSDNDTIEIGDLVFRVKIEDDIDAGCPWEREDGHGPVSDWTRRTDKKPGEVILHRDHGSFRYYDWAGAIKQAKEEGWGLGDEDKAALARMLDRAPTAKEIRAEAVRKDFMFLRGWCNDHWNYVGVTVELEHRVVDGNEIEPTDGKQYIDSLWGIESCSRDYIEETAREMADGIASSYRKELAEVEHWAARDVQTI